MFNPFATLVSGLYLLVSIYEIHLEGGEKL